MLLELEGWKFEIDLDLTREKTDRNAQEHCMCAYCRNFYETAGFCYPGLVRYLDQFGVNPSGPSELMPFEPTLILACYRVQGRILEWGKDALSVDGTLVQPEAAGENSFLLWVGEMRLPWVQEEAEQDVVSPANLPDFLERMQQIWQMRHGEMKIYS